MLYKPVVHYYIFCVAGGCRASFENLPSRQTAQPSAAATTVSTRPLHQPVGRGRNGTPNFPFRK